MADKLGGVGKRMDKCEGGSVGVADILTPLILPREGCLRLLVCVPAVRIARD